MKYTWHFVLLVVTVVMLWLVGKSLFSFWDYLTLSQAIPVKTISWEVIEKNPSKFFLQGSYVFVVEGHEIAGKDLLGEVYLNQYAVEDGLVEVKKEAWTVWYNPNNPSRNALDRIFPSKSLLYALVGLAVFFYFLWFFFQRKPSE
jgi:hypothetical protein